MSYSKWSGAFDTGNLDSLRRKAQAADEPSKLDKAGKWLDTPYIFPIMGPVLRRPFRTMHAGGKAAVEFKEEQRQLHKLTTKEQLRTLVDLEAMK